YEPIVKEYVFTAPDVNGYPMKLDRFDEQYRSIAEESERNIQIYKDNLENPMPIYLSTPENDDGEYVFSWDRSYDLQGDDLTYSLEISEEPLFLTPYIQMKDLTSTSVRVDEG